MANFSKLVITDTGTRLLNRKLYAQEELVFTEMVMSERKYDTALEGLTELEDIRQRTGIRKMEKDEKGVRIGSVFLNSDLEEGYFANTLGLYARYGEDAPVLFAVAAEQTRAAFMPGKSRTLCGMEIRLKITLENTDQITIQMDQSGMATVGDVLELENSIRDHMGNGDNPHHTTKEQVGLGNADDTSDLDKPVSTAQQGAIDAAYQQAAGYTDTRIAQLINGAPSTLDTLGEIAKAMQENDTVVDALEQAMGTKAGQAEVDGHTGNSTIHITASERQSWNGRQTMTGDTKDNTVSFTSGDAANPGGWTDVELIASGEKHGSLWRKVSLFAKNARYLWKLLGSTSLAGIGDGTVTGAISTLNTGLGDKANSVHTHSKAQITDFPATLPASDVYSWAKAASKPSYSWSEIGSKPGTFPPSSHSHDDRYYTEGEINNLLAAKAASNHTHGNMGKWEWKENGQPTWLWSSNEPGAGFLTSPSKLSVGYANSAGSANSVAWNNISGKPSMGQWNESKNDVPLASGENLVSSVGVSTTGWFFVSAIARIRDSLQSKDVIAIYLSTSDSPQYLEWWSNANSASAPRTCHMLQATAIYHINAGQFINLSMWASTACVMQGIRFTWTLLAPG